MQRIIIAGCGYIGARVARLWKEVGADVTCLARSLEACAILEQAGFATGRLDLGGVGPVTVPDLTKSTLYYMIAPPGGGVTDSRARSYLSAMMEQGSRPERIVYLSATSVYSEVDGGVVTEESLAEPASAMGKRRRDAEQAFQAYGSTRGVPVVVLRVSGIYGPGRLPLMQVSLGLPLLCEEESGPSNRIHADDLAAVCVAAAGLTESDVINVSDGHPSSMTSYFNACADLLGYPKAPQVSREEARKVMSPLMYAYSAESRVVDNRRMVERLGITLRYPTMAEGLPACRS